MKQSDVPLGFGMALAQNAEAMQVFSNLPATEKQKVLNKAHNVHSKNEMDALVQSIQANSTTM